MAYSGIGVIHSFDTLGVWLSPPRFSFQSFEQRPLKRISTAIANSKPSFDTEFLGYFKAIAFQLVG